MRHIWLQVYLAHFCLNNDAVGATKAADAAVAKCRKLSD